MKNGLLFDTSIWIDFFLGNDSEETNLFTHYLKEDLPVFTCAVIIQEVLQGIRDDKTFEEVKESFLTLPILTENSVDAAIGAAKIYRLLRKKGITIRKSNDCLIAYYAIRNSKKIIHRNRDFDLISENLSFLEFLSE